MPSMVEHFIGCYERPRLLDRQGGGFLVVLNFGGDLHKIRTLNDGALRLLQSMLRASA